MILLGSSYMRNLALSRITCVNKLLPRLLQMHPFQSHSMSTRLLPNSTPTTVLAPTPPPTILVLLVRLIAAVTLTASYATSSVMRRWIFGNATIKLTILHTIQILGTHTFVRLTLLSTTHLLQRSIQAGILTIVQLIMPHPTFRSCLLQMNTMGMISFK